MKNKYVIYSCVANRADETKLVRIIKIQAHFNVEDLAIALITASDSSNELKNTQIEYDGNSYYFDYEDKICDGINFNELVNKNIKITLNYKDGKKIEYNCDEVGEEITNKPITRTTPFLLSLMGVSRLTYEEYNRIHASKENEIRTLFSMNDYYVEEYKEENKILKDFQRLFNLNKETFYM